MAKSNMLIKEEVPIAQIEVLVKQGETYITNDITKHKYHEYKDEFNRIRGQVITYGYDIEGKVTGLITALFSFNSSPQFPKLGQDEMEEFLINERNFHQKIMILEKCLNKLEEPDANLINKELNFVRKRRNRFAHEMINLRPINEGLDGYTAIFIKGNTETLINESYHHECIQKSHNVANLMFHLTNKYKSESA